MIKLQIVKNLMINLKEKLLMIFVKKLAKLVHKELSIIMMLTLLLSYSVLLPLMSNDTDN